MLRLREISLVALALAGCSEAASDPAKKPPAPSVLGSASIVISGPGRAHAPDESTSSSSPLECTVIATGAKGNAIKTRTGKVGSFAMKLPPGAYKLSFADCVRPCCTGQESTIAVTVERGQKARADWACRCQAK